VESPKWLSSWSEIIGTLTLLGGLSSIKWFPRFWKALARTVASPLLLEIEREKLRAREEQVTDLLEQVEALRKDREGSGD
jgi:hypothetical protein